VHEHVSGDFLGFGVFEIEGGVFLNGIVMIGKVAMNDGIETGAIVSTKIHCSISREI